MPAFSDPAIDWHEFPAYLQSATSCFFGSNVTFHGTDMACSTDIFPTFLQYILFNIVFNTVDNPCLATIVSQLRPSS